MISTDGVGVSPYYLLREDLVGKRLPSAKKGVSKELYIDELNDYSANYEIRTIVGVDPGKDLT